MLEHGTEEPSTLSDIPLSPLIRFGTSNLDLRRLERPGVYVRQYPKSTFTHDCLREYCQYQHEGQPQFRTVGGNAPLTVQALSALLVNEV